MRPLIAARVGETLSPQDAMRLAIQEGQKGAGYVSPNPLVGCVIVDREHKLLASGYHARLGGDHAEVDVLKKLSDQSLAAGAHVYVTLEPCAHHGRTPPCARTLAPLRLASVTYAVEDPNPLVSGRGAAILREAGVETHLLSKREDISLTDRNELTQDAEELAEIFLHNQRQGEPFVAVKIATSLDGQMALANGESQWITSEASRQHAHTVRARYDAVLIGAGTFLADHPSLNIRHPDFSNVTNRAVVLDPGGRALKQASEANLFKVRPHGNVFFVTSTDVTPDSSFKGVHLKCDLSAEHQFNPATLLALLKKNEIHSIMIEGGAATIGAWINAGKVCRLHMYMAPLLIGAQNGLAWSRGFGVAKLSVAKKLRNVRREEIGDDLYCTGILSK